MNRSRKWIYVAQEAQRLADLRLSATEIAKRLGVERQTVNRWINSGKLLHAERMPTAKREAIGASRDQAAAQWSATVRKAYDLDATDDQLVTSAESALLMSRDPAMPASLRLQAMGRFQAIVKQLSLVARAADAQKPDAPKRKFEPPKRTGMDPRGILSEVG